MSGNICAATNSPSPCSKATTTSSTNPAPRGASSPTTPNASHQSHPELGRRSILEADGIRRQRRLLEHALHRACADVERPADHRLDGRHRISPRLIHERDPNLYFCTRPPDPPANDTYTAHLLLTSVKSKVPLPAENSTARATRRTGVFLHAPRYRDRTERWEIRHSRG